MNWRDEAACTGRLDIDWFPTYERAAYKRWRANLAAARSVCDGCPVKVQCLAIAMADPHSAGIWAGTTESQRRRAPQPAPRRAYVARCGTDSGYRRHRDQGTPPCQACKEAHAIAARVRAHRLAVAR